MKTLVIVESPTKANKIQEYLGDDYIVMASFGHITDLAKGGRFGLGIDIENNFKPHYVLQDDKVKVLQELMVAAKQCDQIFLGSDGDREGESISWHLAQRLQDLEKPMRRITFNKITKGALSKALEDAHDIDMNMVHSQECRRLLDRIVGFTASQFLMNNFGDKLSAGRVQSVVSEIIVDREKEIEIFVPEEFWTIQVSLTKDNRQGFTTKYTGRPTDQKSAETIRAKLAVPNAKFIVSEVISEEEKRSAPAPLITSSLQQVMSKEHGFGADRTMKVAQSLYENGYV